MASNQFRYYSDAGMPSRRTFSSSETIVHAARPDKAAPRLVACVDDGDQASVISAHALAIACSLGLEVTFARVIEAPGQFASPADPIEWQVRRRTHKENLRKFASHDETQVLSDSVILAGAPADELSDWAHDHGATMLALGRRRTSKDIGLGSTAQSLLERGDHSLLLVPPGVRQKQGFRRIMVPIDGSARGDAVLPIARRIARTHAADLVLIHVVPQLEAVGLNHSSQLEELRERLDRHKKLHGQLHLEELRKRSVEEGIEVETVICGPDDPRSVLRDMAIEKEIDLIVMASHGNTGMEDVSCGSVTEYLAGHSPVPLLILRPNLRCSFGPEPVDCSKASAFRFEE